MPSKNSRTSRSTSGPRLSDEDRAQMAATSATRRIIPLAGGTWCYSYHPITGAMRHLPVASDELLETLVSDAGTSDAYRQRIQRELDALDHGDFPALRARYARAAAGEPEDEAA